jgi:hypothetical protein
MGCEVQCVFPFLTLSSSLPPSPLTLPPQTAIEPTLWARDRILPSSRHSHPLFSSSLSSPHFLILLPLPPQTATDPTLWARDRIDWTSANPCMGWTGVTCTGNTITSVVLRRTSLPRPLPLYLATVSHECPCPLSSLLPSSPPFLPAHTPLGDLTVTPPHSHSAPILTLSPSRA